VFVLHNTIERKADRVPSAEQNCAATAAQVPSVDRSHRGK